MRIIIATPKTLFVLVCLLMGLTAYGSLHAATYYVDKTAAGDNTGSSWTHAFTDLQSALDAAAGLSDEIWIAAGTYLPTTEIVGSGERYRAFHLKNNVAVYGGFAGGESLLDQRDWQTHVVELSGDIGVQGDLSDNCYHVFHHPEDSMLDASAVLDGCVITLGNGDVAGGDNRRGGGMFNEDASPTILNCTFVDNQSIGGSYSQGGAVYNKSASPTFINCTFENNLSGAAGGAMFNSYAANPTVISCTFDSNRSGLENSGVGDGGAIYVGGSCTPVFSDCVFVDNLSNYNGGAVFSSGSTALPKFVNCRFTDNSTGLYGGAMYNNSGAAPEVMQCVFNRNRATVGNAHGGVVYNFASSPTFTNCVFYDNESGCVGNGIYNYQFADPIITNCILSGSDIVYSAANSEPVVTYCNIQQSGFEATELHNTSGDPQLVDPNGGDFHISDGSPCIDAGSQSALSLDFADLNDDGDYAELTPLDFYGAARCCDQTDVPDTGEGLAPYVDVGVHEVAAGATGVPIRKTLSVACYPNPFNPVTTVAYTLVNDGPVSLRIFDTRGQLIRVLVDRQQLMGSHQAVWHGQDQDGRRVASGVYHAVLETGQNVARKKLVLVK